MMLMTQLFPGFKEKLKIIQDFCLSGVAQIHFEHTALLQWLPRRQTFFMFANNPPHDKLFSAFIFAVINMIFKPCSFYSCLLCVGLSPAQRKA